ncbi:hypothetical protein M407DRAFT_224760 [Tulasnella calospora MUT 4182]|uniref:Uncharacterized protein n=1 Tax=Tulasnella calospora MUT 4182 TaxID=1051891 RepID=A0A0C3LB88_9AGAM|nr:hypothetical protein M407DRAFT_224760 [Tulasnella calospora MUT 4182]
MAMGVLYPLYAFSDIAIIATDMAGDLVSAIASKLIFPKLPLCGCGDNGRGRHDHSCGVSTRWRCTIDESVRSDHRVSRPSGRRIVLGASRQDQARLAARLRRIPAFKGPRRSWRTLHQHRYHWSHRHATCSLLGESALYY